MNIIIGNLFALLIFACGGRSESSPRPAVAPETVEQPFGAGSATGVDAPSTTVTASTAGVDAQPMTGDAAIGSPPADDAKPRDARPSPNTPTFVHRIVSIRATARGTELRVEGGQNRGIAENYTAVFVGDDGNDVKDVKLDIVGVAETWTTVITKLSSQDVRRYQRVRLWPPGPRY